MRLAPLALLLTAALCQAQGVSVDAPRVATLTSGDQRLEFRLGEPLAPTTYVRRDGEWRGLFDGRRPLVQGSSFDLVPTAADRVEDTPERRALRLTGRTALYPWECLVEGSDASPWIHIALNLHLSQPLPLDEPQPTVALWAPKGPDTVTLGQGPESIYGPTAPALGFPAATLWRDGMEAIVFFDMTPMTWMSRGGVERFLDCRVETRLTGDAVGLGMHTHKLTGITAPAGAIAIDLWLLERERPERPTPLEALDTMVRACAPLHPATAPPVPWPDGTPPSWESIADAAVADLTMPGVTMVEIPAGWLDAPLGLVAPVETMVVHADRPDLDGDGSFGWDFSTVNNHLSAWLLWCRLHPEAQAEAELARRKLQALPLFYDAETRLIRWGTRTPPHLAGPDMAWQNLYFHYETLRAADAAPPDAWSPAVAGRFLMATRGLREFARATAYILPQWFDPVTKQPVVQNDMPELGAVREPWQLGSYALLMVRGYEEWGDEGLLAEAETALTVLFTEMSYSIGTGRTRSYDDPTDLPITEIHGNALGAVAAQRLAAITGEARFESASRAFLNSLLRMTFWYDDQTDEVSRDLTNIGLFLPFGGAHSATPWESCEAQLSLVWLLGNAPDLPAETRQLLLKLTGLYRRSALQFYRQTWSERVRALDPALQAGPGDGLPVEPFYSLEGGGHRGGLAAYMAGVGIWSWWVYEALAEATDPEVTVLNLAVHGSFDEAIAGLDRSFLVWNPGPESRRFALRLKRLPAGRYDVIVGAERTTRSQAELSEGLPLDLPAGGSAHVAVSRLDAEEASATLAATRVAQRALERAYAELQMAAEAGEPTDEAVAHFREAMDAYHTGDLAVAATRARDGLAALGQ